MQCAQGRRWPSGSCSAVGGGDPTPPTPSTPPTHRERGLSLALGVPGANVPLQDSLLRLESDHREPRVQRPSSTAPAPPRGGEPKGVVREPEKPEPSRPALHRDGQRALKVRDRRSQLTLSAGTHRSGSGRTRKLYPVPVPFLGHKRPPSRPGAPAPDRGSWSLGCCSFWGSQRPPLQDLRLTPTPGALEEPVCPRGPLKPDRRGTVKRLWLALRRGLWPQQLPHLPHLEVLGRTGEQAGLGSGRARGSPHATVLGAARASLTRTRNVCTTVTWTSSGSTPLNRLCPMDCPTTEEASGERGPLDHFWKAPSLLHGPICAVLVWRQTTRPVHTSARILQVSPVIPGEQKDQLKRRRERQEAHVKG